MMGFYAWSGFFAFIANIGIAFFVYSRNSQERKNSFFFLFAFAVAAWSVGSFLVNVIPDKTIALWVLRGNYLFGVWVPVFYAQLVYELNLRKGGPETYIKLKLFYAVSIILSFFVFTPHFIPSLRVIPKYGFYISQPGLAYYFFFVYFSLVMIEIIFQTIKALKSRQGLERRQFQYLAVSNILAVIAGFEYFLRVFNIFPNPPMDDYILVAGCAVLGYGVTRHRLFDVDALVKAFRKERLATLGLLTSSIHHEIKNPLYVIKGLLETCLEGGRPQLSEQAEIKALLEKVYLQTGRISDVVGRYGKLVKDAETKKGIGAERASVLSCLNYALQVVTLADQGKQVRVLNQIGDCPDALIAPGELEEVFMNLLINAYDAVPEHGEIIVSGKIFGEKVLIKIQDNGKGIPSAQLKNLFKPFYSTKGEKGVGLGLYITKEILERSGGKISVLSQEAKGSTVSFELNT